MRRQAAQLSQRDLAALAGVKQPLIAAIENASRRPSALVRSALDEALQVRPSELLEVARSEVEAVLNNYGIEFAQVVGSVATGADGPESDLDLLVEFPSGTDIVTLLTLEERLSEVLTVPVDIISAHSSARVSDLTAVPL